MVHAEPRADGFISVPVPVPVPCFLKLQRVRKLESGPQEDSTYSGQAYRPTASFPGKEDAWESPQRAFHRLGFVFAESEIETGKF